MLDNKFKISDYFDLEKLPINKLFEKEYDLSKIVGEHFLEENIDKENNLKKR